MCQKHADPKLILKTTPTSSATSSGGVSDRIAPINASSKEDNDQADSTSTTCGVGKDIVESNGTLAITETSKSAEEVTKMPSKPAAQAAQAITTKKLVPLLT